MEGSGSVVRRLIHPVYCSGGSGSDAWAFRVARGRGADAAGAYASDCFVCG